MGNTLTNSPKKEDKMTKYLLAAYLVCIAGCASINELYSLHSTECNQYCGIVYDSNASIDLQNRIIRVKSEKEQCFPDDSDELFFSINNEENGYITTSNELCLAEHDPCYSLEDFFIVMEE